MKYNQAGRTFAIRRNRGPAFVLNNWEVIDEKTPIFN